MRFNAKKCNVLSISRSQQSLQYFYNLGEVLGQVQESPCLGVEINDQLDWSDQIGKITNSANKVLGFGRRNLKYCPKQLKELAYITMIRSKLDYASQVWGK